MAATVDHWIEPTLFFGPTAYANACIIATPPRGYRLPSIRELLLDKISRLKAKQRLNLEISREQIALLRGNYRPYKAKVLRSRPLRLPNNGLSRPQIKRLKRQISLKAIDRLQQPIATL